MNEIQWFQIAAGELTGLHVTDAGWVFGIRPAGGPTAKILILPGTFCRYQYAGGYADSRPRSVSQVVALFQTMTGAGLNDWLVSAGWPAKVGVPDGVRLCFSRAGPAQPVADPGWDVRQGEQFYFPGKGAEVVRINHDVEAVVQEADGTFTPIPKVAHRPYIPYTPNPVQVLDDGEADIPVIVGPSSPMKMPMTDFLPADEGLRYQPKEMDFDSITNKSFQSIIDSSADNFACPPEAMEAALPASEYDTPAGLPAGE